MNKRIIISVIGLILIIIPLYIIFFKAGNDDKTEINDKQLYTCGMHPQIISEEPGLCPICEMKLTPIKNQINKSSERRILYYRNPMNPNITSPTPMKDEMGMDYVPVYEDETSSEGVVTIDAEIQQNMNIKTVSVTSKMLSPQLTTNGILVTDETKEYILTTKVDGWIEKLYVNYTGQYVKEGSKLMEIYSPMLFSAQQEFLTALSYQNSTSKSSLEDIQESGNELLKNAVKKLQLLNVSNKEIEMLKETREVKTNLTLYALKSGTVLTKNIVEGQKIMAGEPLLKAANLGNLWLTAEIYEPEISKVIIGSTAEIRFNYLPGKIYHGKVSFIYPVLDEKSRTVKVRIDVNNKSGELKPSMFANVVITGPSTAMKPVIPENAVIISGKKDLVIVDLGNGKFKPQNVQLGIYSDGYYQILSGLNEGDEVVTSAQFLIDSESNLKAAINQFQNSEQEQKTGDNRSVQKMGENKDNGKDKVNETKKVHKHSMSDDKNIIDLTSFDKNKDGKLFECPMDWDVLSDEEGRCPVCNMKFEEFSISEVKANLDEHGYKYK